jgi:hypothetical protein
MSEITPLWVEYPADDLSVAPVVVERLTADAVDEDLASGSIRLVRDSYAAEYGDVQVPKSYFYDEYDPEKDTQVALRRQVMRERIENGSATYWIVRGEGPDRLDGLTRMMHDTYSSYIGDVITAPPGRRGIGSCALHAAIGQTDYGPRHTLILDAFEGSSVNKWYEDLGFERGALSGYFMVGTSNRSMLMREYKTPRWSGKGEVLKALEAKHPRLTRATVHAVPPQR